MYEHAFIKTVMLLCMIISLHTATIMIAIMSQISFLQWPAVHVFMNV